MNWRAYDARLRQRGSLTVWFTNEAIEGWQAEPRSTPGGQPWYSPLAILTALTLRAVFRLALRQTEGLIGSVLGLLGLDLAVPDHSTLSRRAATLQAGRQPLEEFQHLAPAQLPLGHNLAAGINPVNLENVLSQIQPNRRRLAHPPLLWWFLQGQHLATKKGRRAVHRITSVARPASSPSCRRRAWR